MRVIINFMDSHAPYYEPNQVWADDMKEALLAMPINLSVLLTLDQGKALLVTHTHTHTLSHTHTPCGITAPSLSCSP